MRVAALRKVRTTALDTKCEEKKCTTRPDPYTRPSHLKVTLSHNPWGTCYVFMVTARSCRESFKYILSFLLHTWCVLVWACKCSHINAIGRAEDSCEHWA